MPSILDLVSLFGNPSPADRKDGSKQAGEKAVRAHGLRLLQLTDRDSSVMTVSQVDEYNQLDPVVNIFRTLGQLHKIAISGEVAVMPEPRFAEALVSKSTAISSDMILVPWDKASVPGQTIAEAVSSKLVASFTTIVKPLLQIPDHNLAIFFPKPITTTAGTHTPSRRLTRTYSFSDVKNDVPTVPVTNLSHHIFLPYFGGADDQLALIVVLQLCERKDVTATVVCFSGTSGDADPFFASTSSAYRGKAVKFETVTADDGYEAALERASTETQPEGEAPSHQLVVVGRRAGAGSDAVKGKPSYRVVEEVRDGLGPVAAHFVASGLRVDILAIRARTTVG